jgi:hypothetical protein
MEKAMSEEHETPAPQRLDERAQEILAALEKEEAPPAAADPDPGAAADDPAASPPVSWSKDEKRLFQQLPPALQAAVSRREAERERFLSTRNQELARLQKALDGERARVGGRLDALIAEAERDPVVAEGARLDWDRLRRENLALFARKWPEYQQRAGAIAAARAHQAEAAAATLAERRERAHEAVAERVPEWRDPARREALAAELRGFLGGEGFAPEEIAAIGDHRTFLIALDAMRWRREQEARKALGRKKVAAAPRTQKPGAAEDEEGGAGRRLAALKRRAMASGKLDDRAAYVLAALEDEA